MEELLDVVDANDNVIGVCARGDEDYLNHITRNVVVFLRDVKGNHIVQVRAKTKSGWPGCFDFAACGSVQKGESYLAAAERELSEEIGVSCQLSLLFKRYREVPRKGKVKRLFTAYFHARYDGECKETVEVERVLKLSHREIEEFIARKDARVQPYFVDEWNVIKSN